MRQLWLYSSFLCALLITPRAFSEGKQTELQKCMQDENWVAYCEKGSKFARPISTSRCIDLAINRLKTGHQNMKAARGSKITGEKNFTSAADAQKKIDAKSANTEYGSAYQQYQKAESEFAQCRERVTEISEFIKTQRMQAKDALAACNQRMKNASFDTGAGDPNIVKGVFKWAFNSVVHPVKSASGTNQAEVQAAERDLKTFQTNYKQYLDRWEKVTDQLTDEASADSYDFSKAKSLADSEVMTKNMENYCQKQIDESHQRAAMAQGSIKSIDGKASGELAKAAHQKAETNDIAKTKAAETPAVEKKADVPTKDPKTDEKQTQDDEAKRLAKLDQDAKDQQAKLAKEKEEADKARLATANKTVPAQKSWVSQHKLLVGGIGVAAVGGGVAVAMVGNSNDRDKKKKQQEERVEFYKKCTAELSKTQTVVDPVKDCKNWKPSS